MHRPTLGLIALAALTTAGALWIWPLPWHGNQTLQGMCIRIGLVLGALWLALPQLCRLPLWLIQAGTGAAVLTAWRPRLAWLTVPLMLAILVLRRKKSHSHK